MRLYIYIKILSFVACEALLLKINDALGVKKYYALV